MKHTFLKVGTILLYLSACLFICSTTSSYASPIPDAGQQVINASQNTIQFEPNKGQMPSQVQYGFMTTFGSMYIEDHKIKLTAFQCDPMSDITAHTIDITFPESNSLLQIDPLNPMPTKYNYFSDDNTSGSVSDIPVFGELRIKNVYEGIDLRLYSSENKTIEFDWIIAPGADLSKIKIHFEGQDRLSRNAAGNLLIGLRYNDIEMRIPECYQVINQEKKKVDIDFSFMDDHTIGYSLNTLAEHSILDKNFPLIIDPSIVWSSYFDADVDVAPIFDAYCSGVEIVPCTGESYIIGTTNISVPIGYRDSAIGYDNTGPGVNGRKGIIYQINAAGTTCTAFTYFGTNVTIKAISLFPNGNVIVGGSIDSTCNDGSSCATVLGSIPTLNPYSSSGRGWIAVFNSTLTSLLYSTKLPGLGGNFGARAWAKGGVTAISALDDSNYFVGGICNSNNTSGGTSAGTNFVPSSGVPDPIRSGYEAYIARFSGASYNTKDWATFFGASGNEDIVDMDISTDKTKIVFATSTTDASAAPTLVNPFDTSYNNGESLIGVLPVASSTPPAFSMYSYLGGSGNETGLTIALDSTYLYAYYTTTTSELSANPLPGGVSGSFDSTLGGTSDGAITKALITGGLAGTKTTYVGGSGVDQAGCIAINRYGGELYLFGTTMSADFPCVNSSPPSTYFDNSLGSAGSYDISIAFISTDLKKEKYGIYIGGCFNDYLGETGVIHSGDHLSYNYTLSRLGLATTIHSADMATYGTNCGTGLAAPLNNNPGKFDPFKTTGKEGDAHFIVLWQPTPDGDYGDVPNTYEAGDPAVNQVNINLRFGNLVEADRNPLSSVNADGDDLFAMTDPCGGGGIPDDEDGIDSANLPLRFQVKTATYSVPINCYNNTGSIATVHAWIDLNRDSIFESSEYSMATVPSGGTSVATLNWSINSMTCGNTISPGLSYARFRITTDAVTDNNTTAVDERSISYQNNGEVEDYTVYIRGVDWGDLPNPYPLACATSFLDYDFDGIPDDNSGGKEYPVWLGTKVDIECIAHQNSSATADKYDNGVILPPDSVAINQTYTYSVILNSTQTGKTVYYGMWFDWNFNGNFTDPVDAFYSGSGITNSPVTIPVSVTSPANLGTFYALRVIGTGNGPVLPSDSNVIGLNNGEVEDYIRPTKDIFLPIELSDFNGNFAEDHNHLYWHSNSEPNGSYYIVQRSTDGLHFTDLATIHATGNTNLRSGYAYDDYDISQFPKYYYRLKLVDPNSSFKYSRNIEIQVSQDNERAINIFPNPVETGTLMIDFTNFKDADLQIILTNSLGQVNDNVDYKILNDSDRLSISTGSLPSGNYYLQIYDKKTGTTILSKKIIVSNAGK